MQRPVRGGFDLETLRRDVRYAFRMLRKTPAFTLTAVATLALAIAANTAVFTIVDAALLKPLPFPEPDRLGLVSRVRRTEGASQASSSVDGRTWQLVRDGAAGMDTAVFSSWISGVNLVVPGPGGGQARFIQQQRVGTGFFRVLGVHPVIGREFEPSEDVEGGPMATLLSASLWQSLFDRDPGVIGRTITLRGEPHLVVGVMPDGPSMGLEADLWTPLRPSTSGQGGGTNYQILTRLRQGTGWPQARAEMDRIGQQYAAATGTRTDGLSLSLMPLQEGWTTNLRQPLLLLWMAVAVVLLIACVNLAGLLLARVSGRSREIATRMALGSGRAAVIRQLMVESVVLAAIGGLCGVLLGAAFLDGVRWMARDVLDFWQPLALDWRAVAVASSLALAASLLFGLAPAIHASGLDVQVCLAAGSTRAVAGGSARWPRRVLVVVQVALGVVLMTGAGLLVRTYEHLLALNPGFDASRVVTASVSLEDARYETAARVSGLFDATIERLENTPGIEAAGVSLGLPYERLLNLPFRFADGPEAAASRGSITNASYVSAGYFEALGIPVRRGRGIERRDRADAPPVVVVNDAFVRTYLPGQDPIGRHIRLGGRVAEIVGVVGDVQVRPGWGNSGPLSSMASAFLPTPQVSDSLITVAHGWFSPAFVVRSTMGLERTTAAMRAALDGVDPLLPFARMQTVGELRARSVALQRLMMELLSGLALAALGLTVIGLYGLIATSVAERTREMGIRLALGSTTGQAVRTLTMPGFTLAAIGTAIGLLGASATARLLQGFVWGVSARDTPTYLAVAAVLMTAAAVASALPASRILRMDPARTLRHE